MISNTMWICLECSKDFENKLNLAVCPECLKNEKKNYERGIPSKYETVNMYFREFK